MIDTFATGNIGERKFLWLFEHGTLCWRRMKACACPRRPRITDVTKDRAWQKADDVDFLLAFDCSGCPHLAKGEPGTKLERHEVKTNLATHEGDRTQNIFAETVSDLDVYNKGEYLPEVEAPDTGELLKIRKGVGFMGKTDRPADWYHFFNRTNDGTAVPASKLEAFAKDASIPTGAGLITKWPIDYFLSVRGEYLKHIIETGGYREIIHRVYEPYSHRTKGYLIPVTDLVPGKRLNMDGSVQSGSDFRTGRFADAAQAMVNFVLDDAQLFVKGGGSCNQLYMPAELLEAMGGYAAGPGINLRFSENALRELTLLERQTGVDLDVTSQLQLVQLADVPSFISHFRNSTEFPDFQIEPILQFAKPYGRTG